MKSTLKVSFVQCILLLLLLFVGWEIIRHIILPKGNNWMWIQFMLIYGVLFCLVITVINIIGSLFRGKVRIIVPIFQITILLIYYFSNFSYRPLRMTFLAISGIIAVLLGRYIHGYFSDQYLKNP